MILLVWYMWVKTSYIVRHINKSFKIFLLFWVKEKLKSMQACKLNDSCDDFIFMTGYYLFYGFSLYFLLFVSCCCYYYCAQVCMCFFYMRNRKNQYFTWGLEFLNSFSVTPKTKRLWKQYLTSILRFKLRVIWIFLSIHSQGRLKGGGEWVVLSQI